MSVRPHLTLSTLRIFAARESPPPLAKRYFVNGSHATGSVPDKTSGMQNATLSNIGNGRSPFGNSTAATPSESSNLPASRIGFLKYMEKSRAALVGSDEEFLTGTRRISAFGATESMTSQKVPSFAGDRSGSVPFEDDETQPAKNQTQKRKAAKASGIRFFTLYKLEKPKNARGCFLDFFP